MVEGPFEPGPGRLIRMCMSDGKLYDLDVLEVVVFHTQAALRFLWGREPTSDEIAPYTATAAQELVRQGWFAPEEYMESWVEMKAEELDEDFIRLLRGEFEPPVNNEGGSDA